MSTPIESISEATLSILRCPNDGSELRRADAAQVAQLNGAIAASLLKDHSGKLVEREITGGLVREAGDLLYPIIDGIPVMLFDDAIPLAQLEQK